MLSCASLRVSSAEAPYAGLVKDGGFWAPGGRKLTKKSEQLEMLPRDLMYTMTPF